MRRQDPLTREILEHNQTKLMLFSEMTPSDVKKIWFRAGDADIKLETPEDEMKTEYVWNLPLYMKMYFRFKNTETTSVKRNSPMVYRQVDGGNKRLMISYYKLPLDSSGECMIEFFTWISCQLGSYDVSMLTMVALNSIHITTPNQEMDQEYVAKWRESSIRFYFWLPKVVQKHLLERYNEECVKPYNEMVDRWTTKILQESSDESD